MLLLQKPEFTHPSSTFWGPIIHSDFDCPVILWLWIIGHYSTNYHYSLLIRGRRIYSSEVLKDLQVQPSYLLSSVTPLASDGWGRCMLPPCHPPLAARWVPARPWIWGLLAGPGSGPPWRDKSRKGGWGGGLTVSGVASHTCKWGHGQNSKHGLTKEKAMHISHAIFFMMFPLMIKEIPAYHNRHVWKVLKSEEVKKCTI